MRALGVVERGTRGGPEARTAADAGVTALYAAHWNGLVRLAWLLVRDQQVAEEVVQDAFVAVHGRWVTLQSEDRAAAYLRRCVVNGARSTLRHRGVEQRWLARQDGSPDAGAGATAPSAESRAVDHVEGEALLQALARLPGRQREVLMLRYYLDLSEAQIAEALEISRGSVKAHAHRGLAALRAGWEDV